MTLSKLNYLPLALPFFSILATAFLALVALIEVGALRYAYERLGVTSRVVLLLLLASLIGSYVNIAIAQLPGGQIVSGQELGKTLQKRWQVRRWNRFPINLPSALLVGYARTYSGILIAPD